MCSRQDAVITGNCGSISVLAQLIKVEATGGTLPRGQLRTGQSQKQCPPTLANWTRTPRRAVGRILQRQLKASRRRVTRTNACSRRSKILPAFNMTKFLLKTLIEWSQRKRKGGMFLWPTVKSVQSMSLLWVGTTMEWCHPAICTSNPNGYHPRPPTQTRCSAKSPMPPNGMQDNLGTCLASFHSMGWNLPSLCTKPLL